MKREGESERKGKSCLIRVPEVPLVDSQKKQTKALVLIPARPRGGR